jgi:hypothetical protein
MTTIQAGMRRLYQNSIGKYKTDLKLFMADLAMLLMAYGGFYRDGFGNDTLFQMVDPYAGISTWRSNGRYLAFLLNDLLYKAGFTATDHYKLCFAAFLLLLAFSILIIQKTLFPLTGEHDSTLEKLGFLAATGLLYVNVLFTEDFMFTECFLVYPFAYILASLAVWLILRKNHTLWGIILLTASSMFYQVALVQAAMILAAGYLLKEKGQYSLRLLRTEFISAAGIVALLVLNYYSSKFLALLGIISTSQKNAGLSTGLHEKVLYLFQQMKELLESSLQLLPPVYLPLLVLILLVVFPICVFIKNKNKQLVSFVLFLLLMAILINLIPFIQTSAGFNPRVVFVFYTAVGTLFLISSPYCGKKFQRSISGVFVIFLLIQTVFCNVIMANHYLSNQLDLAYTQQVFNKVCKYEQETGIKVTRFSAVTDSNSPNSYDCVQFKRDQINERSLSIEPYSLYRMIAGSTEDLSRTEMDPAIYEKYFKGRNWDYFDADEQVVIQGDTVYWCIF